MAQRARLVPLTIPVLGLSLLIVSATGAASDPYEAGPLTPPQLAIDRAVFGQLARLGIEPAHLCSDAVFLRRAHLDVIGTLPTGEETERFLADAAPGKRAALVERLLDRPEFGDYWAMRWADALRVKAEFPINLWPNAAQAYHRWILECIRRNIPYDRFARELLTANGSNFRVGAVNFFRAVQSRTPEGIAQAVALTFMGERADKWPKEKLEGMAEFFSRLTFKKTGEWKEEVVFFDPWKQEENAAPAAPASPPQADAAVPAPAPSKPVEKGELAGPVKGVFPDGTSVVVPPGQDPRPVFADWLLSAGNPWFARNIVNRVWAWVFGRGIIHEPDDIRPDNPPSNPALLACLEQALVAGRYDPKHLLRFILNSQTYQLSSVARTRSPLAEANFASYVPRRLEAEVLIDALNQITGTTERYSSAVPEPFTFVPEDQRSIALPDGSITSSFLEMFGRPSRDTGLLSERSLAPTADQRLHLLNSSHIQRKLEGGRGLMTAFQSGRDAARARGKKGRKKRGEQRAGDVENLRNGEFSRALYLAILNRLPTAEEEKTVADYAAGADNLREAGIDLAWALINSSEFLYRH